MNADWSSSGGVAVEPVGGEHLVPVVADPAAGPAVPPAARQAHRVGVGGAEERLGRRGAPVEQQPTAGAVGEAEPTDVHGLGVRPRRPCVPGTGPARSGAGCAAARSAGGPPGRGPAPPARCRPVRRALGVEPLGQVGDRLLEALRDRGEVLLVAGDQRRVGLRGEVRGEVERARRRGAWVVISIGSAPRVRGSAGDSAPSPGPCGKTRARLYVGSGRGSCVAPADAPSVSDQPSGRESRGGAGPAVPDRYSRTGPAKAVRRSRHALSDSSTGPT